MQMKIEAANKLCISGVMIWSLDQDSSSSSSLYDLLGIGAANGVSAATAATLREQLSNATLAAEVASSCYWSLCG
jgi:chitinase